MYKKLLPLALAVLLLASGLSMAVDTRPETGALITPGNGGFGELSITDAAPMDAVAVLVSQDNELIASVYVRSGESYDLKGLDEGMYYLYYRLGRSWSSSALRFSENESFYRWGAPLSFAVIPSQEGIEYTSRSVVLNEDGKGSAWITPISERSFPRIR